MRQCHLVCSCTAGGFNTWLACFHFGYPNPCGVNAEIPFTFLPRLRIEPVSAWCSHSAHLRKILDFPQRRIFHCAIIDACLRKTGFSPGAGSFIAQSLHAPAETNQFFSAPDYSLHSYLLVPENKRIFPAPYYSLRGHCAYRKSQHQLIHCTELFPAPDYALRNHCYYLRKMFCVRHPRSHCTVINAFLRKTEFFPAPSGERAAVSTPFFVVL